jgi:protein-tyrosine kinase
MSRIHEALKKLEEGRTGAQAGPTPVDFPPVAMPDPPLFGSGAVATAEQPMPLPSTGGVDAMMSKCVSVKWTPDPSTMLFVNGNDGVRGAEEFRTLRSRLYQLREKMELRKVLVTSALPKEGKSFTAANLAQVLARQHGKRVLLIDADLRGPRLHLMLGTLAGPGLSDYLQGKTDEFSIMQRAPLENLFFIPSGSGIEDPSELIANGKLKVFLQRVDMLFDWIVIDSPPAVAVSDASVLAQACDGVLMVVRSSTTPADAAQKARQEFPEQTLLGVVLNGKHQGAAPYERYYYEAYEKKGVRSV